MNDSEILRYLPLVRRIARQIHKKVHKHQRLEDLVSAGYVGLVDASKRYNPRLGTFRQYAGIRIEGEIIDYLRREIPGSRLDYERGVKHSRRDFKEALRLEDGSNPDVKILLMQVYCMVFENADKFTFKQKLVFWAAYIADIKMSELSRITGIHETMLVSYHKVLLAKIRHLVLNGKLKKRSFDAELKWAKTVEVGKLVC